MQKEENELSVVMPCLNEEKTFGICAKKSQDVLKQHDINGEVVVVNNGATDNSIEIAEREGGKGK